MAESRTVSRETRLRFARQVSRDSREKSRNRKIGPKMAKIDQFFHQFQMEIEFSIDLMSLLQWYNIQTFAFSLKLCQSLKKCFIRYFWLFHY